jgi:large subunit ribosomal protein L28
MARECDICGKGRQTGMNVSHSHIRTKRVWRPNLQRVRAIQAGRRVTLRVCAKCLKANKVTRAA